MSHTVDANSKMILKRSIGVDITALSLDLSLSNLFWALDGGRTLEVIAVEEGYEIDVLLERANQLIKSGLVEQVQKTAASGSQKLVRAMVKELSKAVGPIADILIEDIAEEAGCDLRHLSLHQMERLVQHLAKEIRPKEKAETFYTNMRSLIEQSYRS